MVDNYFWLREKSNPEVRAYLETENPYTDALMSKPALIPARRQKYSSHSRGFLFTK